MKIIPGGSIPVFAPLLLLSGLKHIKISTLNLCFIFSLSVIYAINLTSLNGFMEYMALLIGPLCFILVSASKKMHENINISVIYLILLILILDTFVSSFALNSSRSATSIFNEPSHGARYLYSIIILSHIIHGRNLLLMLLGVCFLCLNVSFTALLFLLAIFIMFYPRILIFLIILITAAIGLSSFSSNTDFGIRFIDQIFRIVKVYTLISDLPIEESLMLAGGPRLLLSIGGFLNSGFFGVGIGEAKNYFMFTSSNAPIDVGSIAYLAGSIRTPNSYLSQICYEGGFLTLMLILVYLLLFWLKSQYKLLLTFAVFQLFLFSTTVSITPWFILAISMWRRK